MIKTYCSLNVTGTDVDIPRAESIRESLLKDGRLPIIPLLLFGSTFATVGEAHDAAVQYSIELMQTADEVFIYDNPKTSIVCMRDRGLALGIDKTVVDVFERSSGTNDKVLGDILQYYSQKIGNFPPRICIEDISEYLTKGVSADVIIEAIKIGARDNKPWNYINGILKNWVRQKIFTKEQLNNLCTNRNVENNKKMATYNLSKFEKRLNALPDV